MFLYTTIFIVCLVAAVTIPWLYRLISGAGKVVQQAILPGAEKGPTSHLQANPVYASSNGASVPWDLISYNEPKALARIHADRSEAEETMGQNKSYFGPCDVYSAPLRTKVNLPNAGWIQREDKPSLKGTTYKVSRRVKTREKNPQHVGRPSSWQ